jgi:DNA-directed RNA polymerase specialized sigma24 family protein
MNAWLRRIMINTFISGYRRSRAGPQFVTEGAMGSQLICARSHDGSAEDQVVGRFLDPDVIAALRNCRTSTGSSGSAPNPAPMRLVTGSACPGHALERAALVRAYATLPAAVHHEEER